MSEHPHTGTHTDEEDPYESLMARKGAPKHRFPARESDPRLAYALVHDELLLDGVARMNLATFCTTWAEPEVLALLGEASTRTSSTRTSTHRPRRSRTAACTCSPTCGTLPAPGTTVGGSTTGSSEAAMLGGLAPKWRWRKRRWQKGKPTERPNLVCGPVQVCWEKFARYFDVELRQVPLRRRRYATEADRAWSVLRRKHDRGGGYPRARPSPASTRRSRRRRARSTACRPDRASTSPCTWTAPAARLLAPFTAPDLEWDFRLERVKSINASGHKTGLAPLGCGWAVWREKRRHARGMIFNVDYLGGRCPPSTSTSPAPAARS